MKNYNNIPTEDWTKYPETKPSKSGYYLTTYMDINLYYKCLYWDNQEHKWIWVKPIEVGCFVEKTESKYYTECLGKLRELYDITTC